MSRMFVLGAMLVVFTAGCDQKFEVTSVTAGPVKDATTASEDASAVSQPTIEAAPTTDAAPQTATKKTVVDVDAFLDAALDGNLETVRGAIASGVDINATDDQSRTALMFAAFNGHTSIVKLLLDKGALLDHRDAAGRTALMFAATAANAETVKVLLETGAEVNAVDTGEGFTALMHAAAEGQVQAVKILLEHKADPNIRDVDGDNARDFAARNGHAEVVQLLTK